MTAANESIWLSSTPSTDYPPLDRDVSVDVAIIGGGITGLTAARLLKDAGRKVAVVEMSRILSGETGNTTAHLTEALDARFKTVTSDFGLEGATLAAAGSREAIRFIESLVKKEGIECGFERLPGYFYTEKESDLDWLRSEGEKTREAGVDVQFVSSTPLPFPTHGALRFEQQAQFHPREYLLAVAKTIPGNGSFIYENTRFLDLDEGSASVVKTDRGEITADAVFVAAGVPVNDRFAIFTKIASYRSYAMAVEASKPLAKGLFWDSEDPYHYTRRYRAEQPNVLIIGGEDHKTGENNDTEESFRKLEQFARDRFEIRKILNRWSGQIIEPVDGLPFTGRNPGSKDVYVATGYSGQGMTFGTLSAMVVSDLILGRENRYAGLLDATRVKPVAGAKDYIRENLDVARRLVIDRILRRDVEGHGLDALEKGEGKIISVKGKKIALYKDASGAVEALSPICPHLRCDVAWNQHEKSWDCPCHGSRFSCEGRVLNGPAVTDLEKIDPETLR